ncbi:small heat shock protein [Aphelenchoides avenae]|nr:small heat shock protein [Aphelenchus avenae]
MFVKYTFVFLLASSLFAVHPASAQFELGGHSRLSQILAPWTTSFSNAIERMFNDSFWDFGRHWASMETCHPNITDDGQLYTVTCNVKGFQPEDVKVDVQGNILTIRAFRNETREAPSVPSDAQNTNETKAEEKRQPEVYIRSFTQRMLIPDGVKPETIESHFDEDTHTLEIRGERDPKAAEMGSRSVPIRTRGNDNVFAEMKEQEADVEVL